MAARRLDFEGASGATLAARLDRPKGRPLAYVLFAHCFTCNKDIFAASRIARRLVEQGFAVLRFDFTGLGHSEGEFASTNFTSNVQDLLAATDFMRRELEAPAVMIGHSLGGAATILAATEVEEAKAVVTIGAPSEPAHVTQHLVEDRERIEREGAADVKIGGRPFRIQRQFLDDIEEQKLDRALANLGKALLVLHAPRDAIVGIEHAGHIFQHARHPKSFVSLDSADHLLTRHEDAAYVADVVAAWSSRYVPRAAPEDERASEKGPAEGVVRVRETGRGRFQQDVLSGRHRLLVDEPSSLGGDDTGPGPYDYLAAALGACTSITMRMYAERKGWPVETISVDVRHEKIHARDCEDCETREGRIDQLTREISLRGDLSDEQRTRLLEIADKCPVHRTLESEVKIRTREV